MAKGTRPQVVHTGRAVAFATWEAFAWFSQGVRRGVPASALFLCFGFGFGALFAFGTTHGLTTRPAIFCLICLVLGALQYRRRLIFREDVIEIKGMLRRCYRRYEDIAGLHWVLFRFHAQSGIRGVSIRFEDGGYEDIWISGLTEELMSHAFHIRKQSGRDTSDWVRLPEKLERELG